MLNRSLLTETADLLASVLYSAPGIQTRHTPQAGNQNTHLEKLNSPREGAAITKSGGVPFHPEETKLQASPFEWNPPANSPLPQQESESHSVLSSSLRLHGPHSPWHSPGDLPNPEIKPKSPALQADSLPMEPQGKTENMEWVAYPFSRESS